MIHFWTLVGTIFAAEIYGIQLLRGWWTTR